MSELKQDEIFPNLGDQMAAKVEGILYSMEHFQATAATAAGAVLGQAKFDGHIVDAYLLVQATPADGESLALDIKINGTSIYTTTPSVDTTKAEAGGQISLMGGVDLSKLFGAAGAVATVDRTYEAGSTPTPLAGNTVVIEWGRKLY